MTEANNHVILSGKLTRDPEIRYTQAGDSIGRFTLAVLNSRHREDATYVDIVSRDQLAETCNMQLSKTSSVRVEGRLVVRAYHDDAGQRRKAIEVELDDLYILSTNGAPPVHFSAKDPQHRNSILRDPNVIPGRGSFARGLRPRMHEIIPTPGAAAHADTDFLDLD
ncbi:MAG TPA: single-stranded DNA-binding protein [Candidatus Baltobacteraceae bacterium]|nr:single-stranded DNA-binding protein [Candidatus Baltobacteraceae bacterium]